MKIALLAHKDESASVSHLVRGYGHEVVKIILNDKGDVEGLLPLGDCQMLFIICQSEEAQNATIRYIEDAFGANNNNRIAITCSFPLPFVMNLVKKMLEHLETCNTNPLCQQLSIRNNKQVAVLL